MAIFRGGVRVTRALTPTHSSSSSDEEEPEVKKCKGKKPVEKVPDVRSFLCNAKDTSDLFQVGDSTCQLPEELFDLPNLGDILSLQSWNDCLTEKERQHLSVYLPDMDRVSFQETLMEIFSRQNMYFGSPLEDLWQRLKGGLCDPDAVRARQTMISLQRREYYHGLRAYHNGMVNSLREMRELWASDPEANLEEKLNSWRMWKSSESQKEGGRALSDNGKMDPFSRLTGVANNGMPKLGRLETNLKHAISVHRDKKSVWDRDLESKQVLEYPSAQARESTAVKVQGRVHADRPETSSKYEVVVNHRDGVLREGSYLKRKTMFLEDSEHRNKQSRLVKDDGKEPWASLSCEYENTDQYKIQHDGYKGSAIKASDIRALSRDVHSKVCKKAFDKQVSACSHQNWVQSCASKSRESGDSAVISPVSPGFMFSILHFLSAVRVSLVDNVMSNGVKGLPFKEIVARVKACPGDLRVLEMQLPLDCLVRGVLKILASTSKKLSMDGFEPLASYNKARRCWSWIGPVPGVLCTFREVDLQAVSEVWGVSAAILNELQNMFREWFKHRERTLQQLWQLTQLSLPTFPVFPDEKERFRDLRAQKSFTTISPSSYEMRALFQEEEQVRYSTLEIAFRYTAVDGRKSAVAPLRKLGGKSKCKARDHFMLRSDRPSHITILCLVRDAAARLPHGIGTRSDVCILLRDSQFIEDVPEHQLSHVVSGALDRLHYERDPCVRYDQDKKLWLYLHGDREEEDFDEGGTTSTRSSRRSRKGSGHLFASSPPQRDGFHDDLSDPEPDSGSFDSSSGARESTPPELLYNRRQDGAPSSLGLGDVSRHVREEALLPFIDIRASMQPFCGTTQSHLMGWEVYKGGEELSITH